MSEQQLDHVEEVPKNGIGQLVAALALAQTEFKPVTKDTVNPFFKSKYADLATIIAATQPALSKNGLVVLQIASVDEHAKQAGVRTILAHSSGQMIEANLMLPAAQGTKFDAQTVGSAITYSRRYAMQSILGVSADADDDGNTASGNTGSKEAAQAVAKEKIAALETKKNGHAAPPANIPTDDLIPQLQASLDAQNAKKNGAINFPPVPDPEPPKVRAGASGEEVDDVVGEIKSIKDLKTSTKRDYKSVTIVDIFGEVLELSAFDNFKLSDGSLFQYLVAGAIGQQATFTYVSKPAKTGSKVYHNIINVSRIGSHRWDEGVGVLEQAER